MCTGGQAQPPWEADIQQALDRDGGDMVHLGELSKAESKRQNLEVGTSRSRNPELQLKGSEDSEESYGWERYRTLS